MNELTDSQLKRYRRQLILKEVGEAGQKKLLASKVLIIGAGGLGSPIALYLGAAGVGTIGIADHDVIDLSNLQRQILHTTKKIGTSKTASAKKRINELNPDVQVITYNVKISETNIEKIINGYDIVINAVDNVATRYILNKICVQHGIPLVEGAINNFEGHVMTIIPGKGPCYECIFPTTPVTKQQEIGVIGVIPGIIGSLQAMEAIKYIINQGRLLTDRILLYNALDIRFREIRTVQDPYCRCCAINYYQTVYCN